MPIDLLPRAITARQVRSIINFDGGAEIDLQGSTQSVSQSQGVAALWHLLHTRGFAYLADEVGMGKTRQAMAVMALQILTDPSSRIVVVCPGQTLQHQWTREWDAFLRTCYKALDDRLVSTLTGLPVLPLATHDRLTDFADSLLLDEHQVHLLRYSSFSRPLWFGNGDDTDEPAALFQCFNEALSQIGEAPEDAERAMLTESIRTKRAGTAWRDSFTTALNDCYAGRLGRLLQRRGIDLVVFDEAQYLRHIDNRQNTHIRQIFRHRPKRWLFLSATPLHSGPDDLRSLDAYLCAGHAVGIAAPGESLPDLRCPRVTERVRKGAPEALDIVEVMKEFVVRRLRTYEDADRTHYGKLAYRHYTTVQVKGQADPFMALSMALVQKRLVQALDGRNNVFRQGECSSFESLSSSLRAHRARHTSVVVPMDEIYRPSHQRGPIEATVDRSSIDDLNASFRKDMAVLERGRGRRGADGASSNAGPTLPHAKLHDTAERVFARSVRNGSNRKTLIFVRRVDTVAELRVRMLDAFQIEIDRRLALWRTFLGQEEHGLALREAVWQDGRFWDARGGPDPEEDVLPEDATPDENEGDAPDAPDAPYYLALRRSRIRGVPSGMLASFQSRMLRDDHSGSNPMHGFLLVPSPASRAPWERLVALLLGSASGNRESLQWLTTPPAPNSNAFWKLAALQRCLLQSIRQTDLLVDLYLLNRYVKALQPAQVQDATLPDKLLWFLGENRAVALPDDLEAYAANWRDKLALWLNNFDSVVDKCLRSEQVTSWFEVYHEVDKKFARMQPVAGRSGSLNSENAVAQFKFPTHPNVLICTDVLKEGVDLHLFCDEVVHYGVAWTSGDLEQRIGRVDRFGSLINRRLGQYSAATLQGESAPQLLVEFPYLDGTLDAAQVQRVIVEKVRSDLRMDFGRKAEEIGKLTLQELQGSQTAGGKSFVAARAFMPKDVPQDTEQHLQPLLAGMTPASTRPSVAPECVHLPRLETIRVRRQAIAHRLLRRIPSAGKKNKTIYTEEALLLLPDARLADLLQCGEVAQTPTVSAALQAADPTGVNDLDANGAFRFSHRWNTLQISVDAEGNPTDQATNAQPVLLEQLESYWLLRAPVHPSGMTSDGRDLQANAQRGWAYWIEEAGLHWLIAFVVKRPAPHLQVPKLETLALRLGALAIRHRQRDGVIGNWEDCRYHSRQSFPSTLPAADLLRRFRLSIGPTHFMNTLDDPQLQHIGAFMAQVQAWFQGAFEDVLDTLYGGRPRTLQVAPMRFTDGGGLHLQTQGTERFGLQAFVQLKGLASDTLAARPCMIWELVASPLQTGAKPELDLSPWTDLPHADPDSWSGEANDIGAAHVSAGEKYRYLCIYHTLTAWEQSRFALLEAWGAALGRMQGTNFMRKDLCRAFLAACTLPPADSQILQQAENNATSPAA